MKEYTDAEKAIIFILVKIWGHVSVFDTPEAAHLEKRALEEAIGCPIDSDLQRSETN